MKPNFNNHKLIFQLLRQLFVKIVVLCPTGMLNFTPGDLHFIGSHLVKRITHRQNDNLHIIILIIWLIIKRTRSVTLILIMRHSLLTYMELKFKLQLLKFKSSVQKFVNICKYKQSLSLNFAAYSAFNCQAGRPLVTPNDLDFVLDHLSNNLIYCTEKKLTWPLEVACCQEWYERTWNQTYDAHFFLFGPFTELTDMRFDLHLTFSLWPSTHVPLFFIRSSS